MPEDAAPRPPAEPPVPGAAKKKVVILAPVHPPFDVRVFSKEAVSLANNNYEVVLYARTPFNDMRRGVQLRGLRYHSRLHRFLLIPVIALKALRERADIYHLHNPDTVPVGFFLKLCGRKVIYDTHEDFIARIPTKVWIPKALRRPLAALVDLLERAAAKVFDGVIVTQPQQVAKFGGALLIENYPVTSPEMFASVMRKADAIDAGDPDELRLFYCGEINPERGLFVMLELLEELNKRKKTRLWMTGTDHGDRWLEQARAHPAWRHVDYFGYLGEQEEVFACMACADFGLALFSNAGDLARISSNKIFEYQTFGTPFVATSFPERRRQFEGCEGGLWVETDNPAAIAERILEVCDDREKMRHMMRAGRQFVLEKRNWAQEEARLLEFYRRLV